MAVSRRFYVFFWPFQRLLLKQGVFLRDKSKKWYKVFPDFG